MKYVFFGSPQFAAIILEKLIAAGTLPLAIVASPDRPAGRKQELTPPLTKQIAKDHSIPIFQPERPTPEILTNLEADFFLVAAYAHIIPQAVLDLPPQGTFGIHPSLLPRLRGASPIQSTILQGEPAGVTIYKMDEKVDHGPILASSALSNYSPDEDDYQTLEEKLAKLGADIFLKTMPQYLEGNIQLSPQDETQKTLTKKFTTADAEISEGDLRIALAGNNLEISQKNLRKILAFSHEPGAWTILEKPLEENTYTLPANNRLKILGAKIAGQKLHITVFQIAGKPVVTTA
ncbi:MAG: methionyl-tRNA formyltransferase [Patescibacteria group bacterium]